MKVVKTHKTTKCISIETSDGNTWIYIDKSIWHKRDKYGIITSWDNKAEFFEYINTNHDGLALLLFDEISKNIL